MGGLHTSLEWILKLKVSSSQIVIFSSNPPQISYLYVLVGEKGAYLE